ncbi:MAG: hypothetical protein H6739_14635 [Alphaproteobacteria bacterium]|nr:hypothetical protein [Alphaproteobacteria bacterium]
MAPLTISEALLCDVVTDYVPDAGMTAPDRFLGPWADAAPSRALQRAAAANLCFLPTMDGGGSALQRWAGTPPKPAQALRAAARAARHAPPMLWRVEAGRWTPLLPLAAPYAPDGDVKGAIAPLEPERPIVCAVARLYPVADAGWFAFAAVGLGREIPTEPLMERLRLELLRARRHERRATFEDLLRRRPEVLYRWCATWCWLRAEE